ncbi:MULTISPECIES: helix-turn-helix domain-containing protein [Kitasatospora]|uniref:helix-turn-helix domain-containing protein n=1 Tax=Kitasatospora TaxID=2063 RepID=UPI0004C3C589|nr:MULTISPECIES: helix-turn-helix transcriptional regulator [unclassified Kitasatospora]WAL71313.1 helix-turn-helix transcriptional regulator [Kitasatospora sp. YST-16]WNW37351.1 helix-turn-helix transcriptional regulator [Streptomyces sp. Li-HN-5-13]
MTGLQTGSGATARRIQLGAQLRRLREARGVTREDAGYSIRASESKISRMELGRVGFKQRDVADLLTLYGVDDEESRASLLGLVGGTNAPSWWHGYGDVVPGWFQTYLNLEDAADLVRSYEVQFVPGLLQTPEYVHAVMRAGSPAAPEEEIARRAAVRLRRQQRFLAEGATARLELIVDETALRRPCGGPEVMGGQLARLAELSRRETISLRVLPLGMGALAADSGAFTVLCFPEPDLADVVYVEQFTTALYLDKPVEVAEYTTALERVAAAALSEEETRSLLAEILQDA